MVTVADRRMGQDEAHRGGQVQFPCHRREVMTVGAEPVQEDDTPGRVVTGAEFNRVHEFCPSSPSLPVDCLMASIAWFAHNNYSMRNFIPIPPDAHRQ